MVRIDDLEFDATIRQEHSSEAEVTEHPVEQGVDPADHIRRKADTVTFDAIISSTPFSNTSAVEAGLSSRVRDAYAYLLRVIDAGQLVTVTTSLRVYQNMACTAVKPTKDAKTGDALAFTASFKAIRVVSNLIEKPTDDIRGKGRTKLGKQPTTTTPAKLEQRGSILHDLFLGEDHDE